MDTPQEIEDKASLGKKCYSNLASLRTKGVLHRKINIKRAKKTWKGQTANRFRPNMPASESLSLVDKLEKYDNRYH